MNRRRFIGAAAAVALADSIAGASRGARPAVAQRPPGPRALADPLDGAAPGTRAAVARQPGELHALVLGAVQDGGLPQPGCYSERCERARAGGDHHVASLALVEPASDRFWLIDVTPDIGPQMDVLAELHPSFRDRAAARRPFDGIFLTHAHIGHYLGLGLLGNEGLGMGPTPCYVTTSMASFLRDNAPWSLLVDQERMLLRPLEPDLWHDIDGAFAVQLLRVPHRDEFSDTVAFMIRGPSRTLLYLPDIDSWDRWDRNVARITRDVDVALLDGSFYSPDEVPGRAVEDIPHPLIPMSMDRLQEVSTETEIVFTHLNNSNPALDSDGPEAAEVRRRGFSVARTGMRFDL